MVLELIQQNRGRTLQVKNIADINGFPKERITIDRTHRYPIFADKINDESIPFGFMFMQGIGLFATLALQSDIVLTVKMHLEV